MCSTQNSGRAQEVIHAQHRVKSKRRNMKQDKMDSDLLTKCSFRYMEMTAESLHGPNNGESNQSEIRQVEIQRECVKYPWELNSYSPFFDRSSRQNNKAIDANCWCVKILVTVKCYNLLLWDNLYHSISGKWSYVIFKTQSQPWFRESRNCVTCIVHGHWCYCK